MKSCIYKGIRLILIGICGGLVSSSSFAEFTSSPATTTSTIEGGVSSQPQTIETFVELNWHAKLQGTGSEHLSPLKFLLKLGFDPKTQDVSTLHVSFSPITVGTWGATFEFGRMDYLRDVSVGLDHSANIYVISMSGDLRRMYPHELLIGKWIVPFIEGYASMLGVGAYKTTELPGSASNFDWGITSLEAHGGIGIESYITPQTTLTWTLFGIDLKGQGPLNDSVSVLKYYTDLRLLINQVFTATLRVEQDSTHLTKRNSSGLNFVLQPEFTDVASPLKIEFKVGYPF